MPKFNKAHDDEPKPCCLKCGERLHRTHNEMIHQVEVAKVKQELWLCPLGHKYWRTIDYEEIGWSYRSR